MCRARSRSCRVTTTLFDEAQANMPLLSGYALATGEDGQAEVEFTDGSVARVTPNSELRLDKLAGADTRDETTELTMVSGLGYFELNTANGQRFDVHFNAAEARPVTNSIFRVSLDNAPDLSVFAGTVRASVSGAFDQTIEEGNSLHFDANDASNLATAAIQSDTWDQWNQDRDNQITQEAQQQTAARETSGATDEPGWDDLDANGDWYPMEGYGNVWVPSDVPEGWDPYGNGYWANYPGWGYTWISGYSWGWLPYHCGAWNYWDNMGWGWVPGQCGLGWQPIITVWNTPHGWRPPPRPIPGGHIGSPSTPNRLVASKARACAAEPWNHQPSHAAGASRRAACRSAAGAGKPTGAILLRRDGDAYCAGRTHLWLRRERWQRCCSRRASKLGRRRSSGVYLR